MVPRMATTVLIVDDHSAFRSRARRMLEADGFEVVGEAADGASGVDAARRLEPDVVLLDLQLPDTTGFAVAEEISGEGRRGHHVHARQRRLRRARPPQRRPRLREQGRALRRGARRTPSLTPRARIGSRAVKTMTLIDADLPERYRALLSAALDCVVTMDHRGCVVEWNPAAERTFGWSAEEAEGREMADLIIPPALRERHRAGLARYLAGGEPVVLDRRVEITALRRDGHEFPCELTITRIAQPGDPVFVGYLRDITERHEAEAELRASRTRIVTAADDARRRLERDLHDGAQQHLVGLALTLRLARRKLDDPAFAAELLDEAIEDLATATGELRELARGLHPAVLTEGGLEPALVSIAKRAAVPVTLEHAPEERLHPTVEITAYFVVAEALTNVARYAEARGRSCPCGGSGACSWSRSATTVSAAPGWTAAAASAACWTASRRSAARS